MLKLLRVNSTPQTDFVLRCDNIPGRRVRGGRNETSSSRRNLGGARAGGYSIEEPRPWLQQSPAPAKPAAQKGKSHTLNGKVEQVGSDRLTVNHGKVEGYMDWP